ncbi:MAG TPA: hypothetical protein VMN77_10750 [Nitrospiria bacterium]|jgi:hypothetical protein|nr:hypothetical protein [Nitrospiria bacterium]
MQKPLLTLLVVVCLVELLTIPADTSAMMQKLTPEQREAAVKYGKKGVRMDVTDFIKEWSVNNGDKGFAFIVTEFLALAFAAQQAALKSAELNNFDIEDNLAKSAGKLVFRVTLFGSTDTFAKDYTAVIQAGGKTFPATYSDIPPGESYGDGKTKPAFVTDSDFYFPAEGIDPNSLITLMVQDKDGKEVAKFQFDLAKIR